jgi:hypothetical protein
VCHFEGNPSCPDQLGYNAIAELPSNYSRWFGFDFYAFTPERFFRQIEGRTVWIMGDSQVGAPSNELCLSPLGAGVPVAAAVVGPRQSVCAHTHAHARLRVGDGFGLSAAIVVLRSVVASMQPRCNVSLTPPPVPRPAPCSRAISSTRWSASCATMRWFR